MNYLRMDLKVITALGMALTIVHLAISYFSAKHH
jgi:hypothetical protein